MTHRYNLQRSIQDTISRSIMVLAFVLGILASQVFGQQFKLNSGAYLKYSGATIVVNGKVDNAGSITNSGTVGLNITGDLHNSGTFTAGTATHKIGRNWTNSGTFTATGSTIDFNGTGAGTIGASNFNNITLSGAGTKTATGGLSIAGDVNISNNFSAGAYTHTVRGNWTNSGTFTANTSTVIYNASGTQTCAVVTYNNLTLSGSDIKTFATTPIVNGILSMEGTATAVVTTGVVTYGTNATLQYNTATSRTASPEEWITPFAASGGVIIAGTGTITSDAAKVFNASVPLNINSGSTLATGNFQLSFGGTFINNGGMFTAGSSPIVINNSMTSQNIAGFTTTGLISVTKTPDSTATFTGNVTADGLSISAAGGILNLGAGLTHAVSTLTLGGYGQPSGSWGGSGSGATYINSTYFAASSGILNVATSSGILSTWTGATSNDWNTASNWSPSGVPSAASVLIPGSLTRYPVISSNVPSVTTVSVNSSGTGASLTISTGQVLTAIGLITVNENGTVNNSGTITPGTIVFNANSIYNHTQNGGTIPAAAWNAASTCNITGMTSTMPAGFHQTFGNFTWNCAGQSNVSYLIDGNITVNGNFTLSAGVFVLTDGSVARTLTIHGNYIQNGGRFDFYTGASYSSQIYLAGNLTHTAGSGTMYGTGSATNGEVIFNGTGAQTVSFTDPAGSKWIRYIINTGSAVQLLSDIALYGDNSTNNYGEIIVNGTINAGTYTIIHGGNVAHGTRFTLNSGATLITANATGVSGSIPGSGTTKTFSSGANYEFQGAATGTFTTTPTGYTINNLTINRSAGVTLDQNLSVNGILTLVSGTFTTSSSHLLSITNTHSTAISGGSSTSFINGPVKWTLPASFSLDSTYLFPVGSGATYLPFDLVNPTTGTGIVTSRVEAFTASSGGTYDATLASISNSEYWSLVITGNFTNGSVSLTRQTAITPLDVVGSSTTLTGTYTNLAGTAGTYSVTGSNPIGTNRFFLFAGWIQTISTGTISGSPFCAGAAVSVPFTITGTFISGNVFTAQLSDASGTFSSPVSIGTMAQTTAGTISGTIPSGTLTGTGYRIRVVSSTPAITGTVNGSDLTVDGTPESPELSSASPASSSVICTGYNSGTATFTGGSGGGSNEYQYSIDGGTNWSTYTNTAAITTAGGITSVKVRARRSGGTCTASGYNTYEIWTYGSTPAAPTLGTASPDDGSIICAGFNTGTVTCTGGSGGSTGAANEYQVSINGGSTYSAYTNGAAITTTGATTSVVVQSRRTGGSYGCSNSAWSTICTWTMGSTPVAPTLGTANPTDGSTICAGFNTGTVTGTGGSGGSTGAANEYQFSIDGGSTYNACTNGAAITTTGATTSIIVQSRRTGGSYGCSNSAWNTLCTWTVGSTPVAPTLGTASPTDGTTICAGFNTGTVTGTGGSGGSEGAANEYHYSINGGSSYNAYTNGAAITTTEATTSVIVQSRRTGGSYGCSNSAWSTICTWTVGSTPIAPTLGTASPDNGSTICADFNTGTVTGTGGSGGSTGAANEYQYSINGGGAYNAYTNGSAITITGATTSVIVQSRRTGGSYGCSNSAWSTICTWTVGSTPTAPTLGNATPPNGSTIFAGYNAGTVIGTGGSGGSTGAANEYQVSIDGGSTYNAYTNGAAINTTGATTSVIVQSRRTGGSYGCINSAWSTICTWTVGSGAITVSGSTGADGCYTSLTNAGGAFAAINATAQTGNNVVINICSSSTSEAGTNSLNAGVWITLSIYPITTGLTISGSVAGPLINLSGADYVTIDGRVNQTGSTKSLTIANTNASGVVIQFINDAAANAVRYCFMQGVNTSVTSGLIVFGTGITIGNDNNVIEYCDISDGATTPTNAIYSAGTSVVIDNSGNSITNNNIQDYFNAGAASNGILVASNSSAWSITGNRFFQTATRTTTAVGSIHHAINIVTASGAGYTVNNNIIGFANDVSTGITSYDGAFANLYRAIELTVGTNTASTIQGNTVSGISLSTTSGLVTAPGIFSAISVLAGNVNIGTTAGNTIGATTGTGAISITSTTSLGYIAGIYTTSSLTVSIQNNNIGSINTGGTVTIGYTFQGINTAGTGSFTISSNTVGSTSTANSIAVGAGTTTTPICTFNGINNAATGIISITGNTVQNCSAFGTGVSVYNGIINSGGAGTLAITGNSIISGTNTGTGAFTGISNSAAAVTANINTNIIRSHTKAAATGIFTAISNTGAALTAININSNQLGNADGDLITYTVANSSALTGISNTAGAGTCALSIQNNDIRGIVHSVAGSSAHTYITNTAATLSQNIGSNTFTNLIVNTTGSVTFITVSNALYLTGVQTVSGNSIVTSFSKTGAGGTVTFCTGSGISANGSSITHSSNDFSNVTVTGVTIITGWSNTNTSLNKTFSNNKFRNWTGGSAAVTVMLITGGASTISHDTISNITTGTAGAAAIIAISSGATEAISITDNFISGLVTGSAAFINSFTGITNAAGNNVTITGNTITGCTAGGTAASIFTGITAITAGSGTLIISGDSIISGTNAGTGAFNAINNSTIFTTVNLNSNIIRNCSVATGTFTAIANSGFYATTVNINSNQLGNASGGLVTYTVASGATLTGISNAGVAATCALSIQNNDIRGIVYSVAGTNIHNYITNSAPALSQNISNNTFTNLSVNTSGAITFISDNVIMPASGTQNVNSNSIVTSFTRTAASGAITLFTSAASTDLPNVTVNNNNNNFSNITINGTATISGWINTDAGVGNVTKIINGNTFNNWTAGTGTGAITAMNVNITSPNNATKNNTISNISSAGTITGITTAAGNDSILLNTIYSLVSTGTIANVVNGIAITGGTTKQIYRNTIYNLQANNITTGSVSGIAISAGLSNTIFRNKIYDISSSSSGLTGTVNGILVSGTVASQINTIYNNMIGDLRASAANVAEAIRGISIVNTGAPSATNVYYNTVYLNATSSGTIFGSTGIYHAASATASTATLDLRNNIIVNLSTPNSTGLTVAYRRSAGTAGRLSNYAATSNNNLFYAGTPGASRLIYSDGTSSAQTLALYKAGVFTAGTITPRDQASVTESPTFISTAGADATFLHINTSTGTQIESGAVNISSITVDFDGTIRQGNTGYTGASATAPDIGADEGDFVLTDLTAPAITYTLIPNNNCLTTQSLSAIITDASGVNTTSGTTPRIYYKRSTDGNAFNNNTPGTAGWKFTETPNTSSPYIFTMDFTLLSGGTGVTAGQTVQYFVVAQDLASTIHVGINVGTFAATPTSVALTSAAFPIGGTINSYLLLAGLTSPVTIGAAGTYPSLTGAGGLFSVINTNGLSGNLVATIIDASITETGANSLNAVSYGCNTNYTLTISPNAGLAVTLTGSYAGPLINLNGADNVTIDGLNTGGSSLSISNTSAVATASTIQFIADAINNTITNCTIEGSGTGAALGTISFSTGSVTGNDGNTISYNTIKSAGVNLPANAIYSAGTSVVIDNSGAFIANNDIKDYFNAAAASNGILVASNSSAWSITGNKLFQTATRTATSGFTHRAINIVTVSGVGYTVNNNIIGFANNASTGTTIYEGTTGTLYRAIELTVGTSPVSNVQGNTVSGISLSTTSGLITAPGIYSGISILAGSVNIGTTAGNTIGATTGTGSISITSTTSLGYIAGIYATSYLTVSIQNNNIGSISTGGTATIGYTFHGINTAGTGSFTISSNTVGSTGTANSIAVGADGTTITGVCTFNGINNAATGIISITGNTVQNCSAFGTAASVYNGIINSGGAGTLGISGNNIISGVNTGTGAFTGISNSAAPATANINTNIIRSHTKTAITGIFTAISNTGAVLTAININSNQLGNATGDLITYTAANNAALTGINSGGGTATCALSIQNNDIRGIVHSVAGSSAHTYITNSSVTLSQNISNNTFTNLSVNTTGSVTFITVSNALGITGVQTVSGNSIVTGFSKTGAGGTVTFCTGSGISVNGSSITHSSNDFSNVTVTGVTIITGWSNTNTSLNKTFSNNKFRNWTGGSAAVTVMSITSGASAISHDTISNITTGTAGAAAIIAISSGATEAISITDNFISALVTGSAAFINSFTGITNAAGNNVTITGNSITGCTAGGTAASIFTGITAITAGSGTLIISGDSIISGINAGTGAFTAISNSVAFATININNNIIRSNTKTSGTGAFTAIVNSGAAPTAININYNQLGNADGGLITYNAATAIAFLGISNTGGLATCALSVQNNDIRGIVHSVAGTNAQTYIINSAATLSQIISSNTFTALSVNTTGAIIFISDNVIMPASGTQNVNSNSIVTSFTRSAASGAITLFTSTASTDLPNVTVNNNNNNFSNITINGSATISGWINTDAGLGNVTKTLNGNTFNNWTAGTGTGAITAMNVNITSPNNATKNNTISNISSAGTITGITTAAGNDSILLNTIQTLVSVGTVATVVNGIAVTAGTTKQISRNTIYTLQANNITTGSVSGIAISAGLSNTIFRNKIYDISSGSAGITTGTVNGVLVSAAVANQVSAIYNNMIGDLRATAANAANPIIGINISNTGVISATNVYYNTIFLNAVSSGTDFGSTGIYHTASTTATTATLDLRNNIVVNLSTPNGAGLTVAYRRSAGTVNRLNNYATTSNNNLFYAGTPGTSRLIYADGTSYTQELAVYKASTYPAGTIAPRDQASITENPPFLSITGSDADFLKISPTATTNIESGAVNIATITTDFDGDIRAGNPGYPVQQNGFGTAPDIGADEFDGRIPNVVVSNASASSNGDYPDLSAAFAAINGYDQNENNILVTIIGNTTETTTATLNAGTWTTLTVIPSRTGLTVTGNMDAAPLIDLNGAGNVILDGRVGGTGTVSDLIITNTSASAIAGSSTIRFMNSAENNTVKYCNIRGSSTSATGGIIVFSTATSGNGNDNNVITLCNITNAGANRPVNAIYSLGSSGYENSGNTIDNNNIYDFFNAGATSNGINIGSNSIGWTITGNSFYETTTFSPTGNSITYSNIVIDNTSGNNFIITGNYIGGSATQCGGSACTMIANYSYTFHGIDLNVGTANASSIQNNTIRNFDYTGNGYWYGIKIDAGSVNIGTTNGNTIGAATGTGSVTISKTANYSSSYGIYILGSGIVNTENNNIGSITTIGSYTYPFSFYGIFSSSTGGTGTIINNLIGSNSTANSIQATASASTSTTPQYVSGIYCSVTGSLTISNNTIANLYNAYAKPTTTYGNIAGIVTTDGVNIIQNNTIRNLSTTSPNTSTNNYASVIGISQTSTSAGQTVSGNTIYDLSNTYSSTNTVRVFGLYYAGPTTGTNTVSGNFIHSLSLSSSSTSSIIAAIRTNAGATTYSNNIINLGAGITTGYMIYGFYENGAASNDNSLYFNTVFIGGTAWGTTSSTYAFYNAANTNTRDFRNNILYNARTGGSTGQHYAVYLTGNTGLTINYNDYYTSGTGGVLGNYNGVDKTNLTDWQAATGQDVNSLNTNPGFATAGGTNAIDYKLNAQLDGVFGTGILLDYGLSARGTPPNMGAWEFNTNRWKGNISTDFAEAGNWTSSVVPVDGASIVFDNAPDRDCYLDGNRTVGNITNIQPTYKLVVNAKDLTITGNLYFTNGAQIDAKATSSNVFFAGTVAQTIPDGAFVDNEIYDLTINNSYGVSLQSDLTVLDTLNLHIANPSDLVGCLDAGTKTLTLGSTATTIGQGDVTGIVKRTTIFANTVYTFGNKFATIYFPAIGTLPSSISVKTSIGATPSWRPGAIKRIYDIIQTGADPYNPCAASITAAYLDSELNGNDEDSLVFWSFRFGVNWLFEHGRADHNLTDNWVKLTNMNMAFFSSGFGAVQITLDESELDSLTWNGSVNTSWTTVNNWTPNGAPSDYVRIIIPDASTTPNDPVLPPLTSIKSLKIKSGGILNSITGAQATIKGGEGAWSNHGGTFNPGTSTVIFTNAQATISGSTAFNDVTINNDAVLWMIDGSYMSIAGAMNNYGPWRTVINGTTTVEYNGGNQTVVVPNPATNRYSTLILSNSGTKTMPATPLAIYGDFSLLGTVTVTALNDLEIRGALSVGSQATFVTGAYNHSIGGDFTHDGAFTAAGSAITFNGFSAQIIKGSSSATLFNNLTVFSGDGVSCSKNITVNGILDLQSDNPTEFNGSLDMGSDTLLMGASATTTGTGDVTGIVRRTAISADISYTFGNRFTTIKFGPVGTLPSALSVKISLGNAPAWKPTAIQRIYDFVQTGGTGCFAEVASHYLDSELNTNAEGNLVYWGASGFPTPVTLEWGRSEIDTVDNYILLENVPIELWPSVFNQQLITLAASEFPTLVWNGSQSTSWDNPSNWTPSGFPDKFKEIVIPDANTTPNDPLLPSLAHAGDLTLENGAILNASSGTQFNIYNLEGGEGWNNLGGTFNPATSSVIFINPASVISGTTNFHNLTILTGADLTPQTGNIIRIAGTLSNSGTLDVTLHSNTIEYHGAGQTVIIPNGTIPGYYNLTLSGNGTKTMPVTAMDIYGNFFLSDTASATAGAVINTSGNFTIGSHATFIGGAFTHTVSGNWTNSGTFTATGSTIDFNGATASTIGAGNFNHITISGAGTKTGTGTITASGNFDLTSGAFVFSNSASNSITISGNYSQTGGLFDFNTTTSGTSAMFLGGNMTLTTGAGGMTTSGAGAYNGVITFNGSGTQTLSIPTPGAAIWVVYSVPSGKSVQLLSNITLSSANGVTEIPWQGAIIVNGTFDLGTYTVTQANGVWGTAVFTVNSGATLITANAGGISGSVPEYNMTTTYSSGADYEFQGASTGTFTTTPAANTVNNLIINYTSIVSLTNSLIVTATLSLTNGMFTIGANTLTISGSAPARTSGTINASNAGATLAFTNTAAITLPASIFTGNVNNLTINGAGGITASSDFAINGVLDLQSANPSTSKGSLDLWDGSVMKTITMGASATTIGTGDVTGIVTRTGMVAATRYTFGNQYTSINFQNVGTIPSVVSLKITIGSAPSWKPGAIKRTYDMIQSGANGSLATMDAHYLDSELNGNTENILVFWVYNPTAAPGQVIEFGRSNYDMTNNWVEISSINVSLYPPNFGQTVETLGDSQLANALWNGSISTEWINPLNWTPNGVPSDLANIIIPDAGTTPNDPTLNVTLAIGRLTIQSSGILNSDATSTVTISGGSGAWSNNGGTFNASASTVIFTNATATLSGETDFYNVTINSSAALINGSNGIMRIGGTMTNNGIWRAALLANNTVEYNGGSQTVLNPNAPIPGYYNLILSGSGTKTMPGTALNVHGDFTMSGTAIANAGAAITTAGNFTIGSGTDFTTGALSHSIGGNFSNSGTFTATGGTIICDGSSAQTIGGTAATTFNDLIITNTAGVTVTSAALTTVSGALTINSGKKFSIAPGKQLTVTGTITNDADTSGFVLQSDATGTASLIHNTNTVPATMQRYISGDAEAWHFLSSPVSDGSISGSWLPPGTYGNDTGYDLYVWDEPTNCWIYKNDSTSTIHWNMVHPGSDFIPGRGYLYSVQAANPTKAFEGNLNNGTVSYGLTASSSVDSLKGFNLVGNPYPSSVDWHLASGWSRSDLVFTGGGYNMWIWNPAAKNYGVYNSADADGVGTNSVTRYIAPMQGYFVLASGAGNLGMDNDVRVHDGAGNWFKNIEQQVGTVSVNVNSDAGSGSDEIQLGFGNDRNENVALKLFSKVKSAPSLFMPSGNEYFSVRYLTDTIDNPTVPVMFKPGRDGNYTLRCDFIDYEFDFVVLEDRQRHYIQNMKTINTYRFQSSTSDDASRFVLHFGPGNETTYNELPARIYTDGTQLIIDLTLVGKETDAYVCDLLGRILFHKTLQGLTQYKVSINAKTQIIIVYLRNQQGKICRKIYFK